MSQERLEELGTKIDDRTARVGVIGLGYVGLPLAVEFAKAGFQVVGFDIDREKVHAIERGDSYIGDVSSEDLQTMREAGRISATSDFDALHDVHVVNICVPTPLTKTRDPDVSFMAKAVEHIRAQQNRKDSDSTAGSPWVCVQYLSNNQHCLP